MLELMYLRTAATRMSAGRHVVIFSPENSLIGIVSRMSDYAITTFYSVSMKF